MRRLIAGIAVLALACCFWPVTGMAGTFVDDLRALQTIHRTQVELWLSGQGEEERTATLDGMERSGRSAGDLGFDRDERGALRYLGGFDVRIPVAAKDSPTDAAFSFLETYTGLFDVERPRDIFRALRTDQTAVRQHVHFEQAPGGMPVFGTGLTIHLQSDNSFAGFSGNYLPEHLLPTKTLTVGAPAADSRLGVFHGSLFGLSGWESRNAEPAFKTPGLDEQGLAVFRYTSAMDEAELFVEAAYFLDAESDSYHSPNGTAMMGDPIRLDSTQTCGTGTYPNCTWLGTSASDWLWTIILGAHLSDRYGRDSWDNAQTVADCSGSYHRMATSSDVNVSGTTNAVWRSDLCGAGFGTDSSNCYDIIGHEFGHGMQQADIGMNPVYGQHSSALSEGLADVVGEFFDGWISATGDPDWVMGTGDSCMYTRNLSNPAQSRDMYGSPIVQPAHASMFQPPNCLISPCGDHFDATIVGKTAHLLGRPSSDGSITHWGIPVTGIGGNDASLVFYGAINQYLSTSPTFSDLRDALLDSAEDQFGGTSSQYNQTRGTVDAMGYWTHKYDFGFASDRVPSTAYFMVNGSARRYVFDIEGGSLKYRYRTCTYSGMCSWSAATSVYSATNGVSAVVHDGVLWAFWDYNNSVYYKKFYSDGTVSSLFMRSGASTSAPPVALHVAPNLLYLLYRDVAPFSTTATVRLMQLNGATWSAATATQVSTRSPFSAIANDDVHLFYRDNYLNVVFKMFDRSAQTWTTQHAAYGAWLQSDDSYGPSVALYRGRLHVVANMDYSPIGLDDTVLTASCAYPCLNDNWTAWTEIDGTHDSSTQWSYLFPEDSHLLRADYVPAGGSNSAVMTWRWKNSE